METVVEPPQKGDAVAWNEMENRIGQNLDQQANWNAALEYIDPVATADYFLLNIYTATWVKTIQTCGLCIE